MQLSINKQLLIVSVALSLLFHISVFLIIERHWHWQTFTISQPLDEKNKKQQILNESFQELTKISALATTKCHPITSQPNLQHLIPDVTPKMPKVIVFSSERSSLDLKIPTKAIAIQSNHKPSLVLDVSTSLLPILTKQEKKPSLSWSPRIEAAPALANSINPPSIEKPVQPEITYKKPESRERSLNQPTSQATHLASPHSELPEFPTLDELSTFRCSDQFDVDIVCLPNPIEKGYLFALTLIPHEQLHYPEIHQNYTFLIDRSNSIQKERLSISKSAVLRAIKELKPTDPFNIVVFDSKIEKLFSSPRHFDSTTYELAKNFLDQISLGSFFSPADLYQPLLITLPQSVSDDEMHTVILLTDGEAFTKKSAFRSVFQSWTRQNEGKVALHVIALSNDPHLSTLEALAAFNHGHLLHSSTKTGIKRKILKLMNNVHIPLAKNIVCSAISPSSKPIEIYPNSQSPTFHLYQDNPLVIIGRSQNLDDFVLFVQGKFNHHWMNIKKKISFVNAKKGDSSLLAEWAIQQAHRCYQHYIIDENPQHLQEASRWLHPFNLPMAFP